MYKWFRTLSLECAPNPRSVAQDVVTMVNAKCQMHMARTFFHTSVMLDLGRMRLRMRAMSVPTALPARVPRRERRGVEDPRCRGADGVRRLEGEEDGLAEGLEPRVELAAYHPVRALVQVLGARPADSLQRPEAVVHLEPVAGKGGRPAVLKGIV